MSLFNEFKRRGVFKVSVAYIVIGWILLQVSATLEETLELPDWFDKFTLSALLLGFPLALLLAWAYDIHPDSSQPTSPTTSGKTVFIVMLLALVLGGAGYSYYIFRNSTAAPITQIVETTHTPTIAVLPFADFSPSGDQVWFADGISDEILNVLTRTKGLKVASRKASFHFRDEDIDLKTVAAELNVETILEGSVRTQGDQLRITAQLFNAADGFHIWSDTYERQMKDIFAVQDEIATNIATALFGELGVEALPEQRFKGTRNIEAYSYYLHGMEKLNGIGLSEKTKAAPYFDRALSLDPEFADAWVGLAITESIQRFNGLETPAISPSLRRALSLDPNNADAITGLAWVNRHLLHWFEAEQLFLRAISLEPNNATVRLGFGQFLRATGRVPEALEELLKAWDLGSTDQNLGSLIVNTYAYLGKFPEARAFYEAQLADIGIENMRGNQAYFVALLADGMEAEARAFATQEFRGPVAKARIEFFLERLDGISDAEQHLIESTLIRIEESEQVFSSDIEAFLLAGDVELARKHVPRVQGFIYGAPNRFSLFVNEDIDPRYLPFRGNLLLLHDMYPAVVEAYLNIGVDLVALGKEKGFLE